MQPLKAEADVVQNIYPTRNNKPAHGRRSGGGFRSKMTNNPGRQRSRQQTTAPRCAGTRCLHGRERERERDEKAELRTKKHGAEEQLSFSFINLNLPTRPLIGRNSMHA